MDKIETIFNPQHESAEYTRITKLIYKNIQDYMVKIGQKTNLSLTISKINSFTLILTMKNIDVVMDVNEIYKNIWCDEIKQLWFQPRDKKLCMLIVVNPKTISGGGSDDVGGGGLYITNSKNREFVYDTCDDLKSTQDNELIFGGNCKIDDNDVSQKNSYENTRQHKLSVLLRQIYDSDVRDVISKQKIKRTVNTRKLNRIELGITNKISTILFTEFNCNMTNACISVKNIKPNSFTLTYTDVFGETNFDLYTIVRIFMVQESNVTACEIDPTSDKISINFYIDTKKKRLHSDIGDGDSDNDSDNENENESIYRGVDVGSVKEMSYIFEKRHHNAKRKKQK
jgi:hypothetical protein